MSDRFMPNFSGAFGVDFGWEESMIQKNRVAALGIRDALDRERRRRGGKFSDKDIAEILGIAVAMHVERTNDSEEPEPRIFRAALILRVARIISRKAIREADALAGHEAERFIARVMRQVRAG